MVSKLPRTYADPDALVEDLLWLVDPTAPKLANAEVMRRLGYSRPDSLYRRLYRIGRADLAAMLQEREADERLRNTPRDRGRFAAA